MDTIVEIVGVNEDVVRIAGDDAGQEGVHLDTELEGFYDPTVEVITKRFGAKAGQKFIASRKTERRIVFRVLILDDKSETWRQRDARWRRLWSFDDYSTIRVITDESSRELQVRLERIDVKLRTDPHLNEVNEVVMEVVADDPFWYAPDEVQEFVVATNFSSVVSDANPTGNHIYPIWVFPEGEWSVTEFDYDRNVPVPVQIPAVSAGNHLIVDTDPSARQLQDTRGTNIWALMNGVRFSKSIPPFAESYRFMVFKKDSTPRTVQLRLKRPFDRPWGWS